jgi:hypothetical protein
MRFSGQAFCTLVNVAVRAEVSRRLDSQLASVSFNFSGVDARNFLEIVNGFEVALVRAILHNGIAQLAGNSQGSLKVFRYRFVDIDFGIRRKVCGQVIDNFAKLVIRALRAALHHADDQLRPAFFVHFAADDNLGAMARAADSLRGLLARAIGQLRFLGECEGRGGDKAKKSGGRGGFKSNGRHDWKTIPY